MKKMMLALAACVALAGCSTQEERATTVRQKHVPPGAKNVVVLGDDWYTFELETDGKKRKFLYRAHMMGSNAATSTITELRD